MNVFPSGPQRIICTCSRGTERALRFELKDLGAPKLQVQKGAVEVVGPLSLVADFNVFSRLASKVLWHLHTFEADSEDAMIDEIMEIPFEEFVDEHKTIAVETHLIRAPMTHTLFAAQRVKDAICDRMRARGKPRPDVDPKTPAMRFVLHWEKNTATFSLDTTGMPLFKRGFRQRGGGPAPMKENLAAALLAIGHADVRRTFIDPVCGSGTLGVEQTMRSLKFYPGAYRRFGLERWTHAPKPLLEALHEAKQRAKEGVLEQLQSPVLMSDIDTAQVDIANDVLQTAGLAKHTEVLVRDALTLSCDDERPVVVGNLPYGERMGEGEEQALKELYRGLGQRVSQMKQPRFLAFSAHERTEEYIGLGPAKTWQLWSGPLRTTLHRWDL